MSRFCTLIFRIIIKYTNITLIITKNIITYQHGFRQWSKRNESVSSIQYGQASLPWVLHPDNIPYAGKSLIVHNRTALSVKFCFRLTSNVGTPMCHKSFSSLINGCRNTSKLFFGWSGPGINKVRNITSLFKHISGGKLYGDKITGHKEY